MKVKKPYSILSLVRTYGDGTPPDQLYEIVFNSTGRTVATCARRDEAGSICRFLNQRDWERKQRAKARSLYPESYVSYVGE